MTEKQIHARRRIALTVDYDPSGCNITCSWCHHLLARVHAEEADDPSTIFVAERIAEHDCFQPVTVDYPNPS